MHMLIVATPSSEPEDFANWLAHTKANITIPEGVTQPHSNMWLGPAHMCLSLHAKLSKNAGGYGVRVDAFLSAAQMVQCS